ncbi:MAG: hypothetical protein JSR48_14315 [Verrucomicrobia bacterium]|nr:hypothetical protein [Verrucomicrobiota bacterium]
MRLRPTFLPLASLLILLVAASRLPAADAPSRLVGTWALDVARSTPIRPWDRLTVMIAVAGDTVTLTRHLAWGADRKVDDVTTLKTDGRTITANPVAYWLDTWYTNVYIGGDRKKLVTGEWLDGGRVLKVEANLQLEAQQGDHPVHLYDEYRLSADGRTLRLYELRSTRDEPMVYLFTRQ